MPIDALSVSCAPLTRDLLAIAEFLFYSMYVFFIKKHLLHCLGPKKHMIKMFIRELIF